MIQVLAQATSGGGSAAGWVIVIGVAVIFGAWSANAAERKGYPRSTGWILGVLLGLIGRIIVGVLRDKQVASVVMAPASVAMPPRPDQH